MIISERLLRTVRFSVEVSIEGLGKLNKIANK